MDCLLLVAVTGLTFGLSNQLPIKDDRAILFVRSSLGLSLSLFTLSLLDATPPKWNLVVAEYGYFGLATAYQLVLWAIAVQVTIVGPFLIGMHVLLPELPRVWIIQFVCLVLQRCIGILFWPIQRLYRGSTQQQLIPLHNGSNTNRPSTGILFFLSGKRLVGGIGGVLIMLAILHTVGPMVMEPLENSTFLTQLISALSAVGIVVSSLMNGFGSVSMPFNFLKGSYLPQVSNETVTAAEVELEKATTALSYRKEEWQSKKVGWNTTSRPDMGLEQRRKQLETEMEFLQSLVDELADNVTDLRQARATAASARTPWGRVRSCVGIVFSAVLVVRLIGACYSILIPSSSNQTDLVTGVLVFLMGNNYIETVELYNTVQQSISLLLTAVLSVTQMRTFLRTWGTVQRRLAQWFRPCVSASKDNSSTEVLPYVMALLMACYCLACSALTKKMLPAQYHTSFSQALSDDFSFSIQMSAVHSIFVAFAVISAGILAALLGIQHQQTTRYQHQHYDVSEP